jgi:hypothetical protein
VTPGPRDPAMRTLSDIPEVALTLHHVLQACIRSLSHTYRYSCCAQGYLQGIEAEGSPSVNPLRCQSPQMEVLWCMAWDGFLISSQGNVRRSPVIPRSHVLSTISNVAGVRIDQSERLISTTSAPPVHAR